MRGLLWAVIIVMSIVIIVGVVIIKNKGDSGFGQQAGEARNPRPYPSTIMTNSARKVWNNVTSRQEFSSIGNVGIFNCRLIEGSSDYSQHAWGNAIDFTGTSSLMEQLRNYLEQNANKLNINYVIYNRQISKGGKNRHTYEGVDPHTSHVHVDFYPEKTGTPICANNIFGKISVGD